MSEPTRRRGTRVGDETHRPTDVTQAMPGRGSAEERSAFRAEAERQARLVAADPSEADVMDFIDAAADWGADDMDGGGDGFDPPRPPRDRP
jgi:hypothetical protein